MCWIGQDLYGERFENFQRILAQLKAKDEEREVQAVLDRHPRPFGGGCALGNKLRDRGGRCGAVRCGVRRVPAFLFAPSFVCITACASLSRGKMPPVKGCLSCVSLVVGCV